MLLIAVESLLVLHFLGVLVSSQASLKTCLLVSILVEWSLGSIHPKPLTQNPNP